MFQAFFRALGHFFIKSQLPLNVQLAIFREDPVVLRRRITAVVPFDEGMLPPTRRLVKGQKSGA